jgi:hypothetical protein
VIERVFEQQMVGINYNGRIWGYQGDIIGIKQTTWDIISEAHV